MSGDGVGDGAREAVERVRAAILGDETTIWLKERGVDLYRFAHRDERLGCTITETYVKESDVVRAFDAAHAGDQP